MFKTSEIITTVVAGICVVGLTLGATFYVGGAPSRFGDEPEVPEEHLQKRAFDLSDAVFPCRDQIQHSIPNRVRQENVDSSSSRYDQHYNAYVVHIDLEVQEKPGEAYGNSTYNAHIVCHISAANNELMSFRVRRM